VDRLRSDGGEWCKDESAESHSGVRYQESGGFGAEATEKQEVEIESALTPADAANPAGRPFNLLKPLEQGSGIQGGGDLGRRVQERALASGTADRGSFKICADRADRDPGGGVERGEGEVEDGPTVAEIAA
jgi:hypothetical protein